MSLVLCVFSEGRAATMLLCLLSSTRASMFSTFTRPSKPDQDEAKVVVIVKTVSSLDDCVPAIFAIVRTLQVSDRTPKYDVVHRLSIHPHSSRIASLER